MPCVRQFIRYLSTAKAESERYHRVHDGTTGMRKIASWGWLLWLNFCYYLLFCRFLGKSGKMEMYMEIDVSCEGKYEKKI